MKDPKDIIQALEKFIKYTSPDVLVANDVTFGNVLYLITQLQEENRKLTKQVNRLKQYDEERDIQLHARLIQEARSSTAKEIIDTIKTQTANNSTLDVKWLHNYLDNIHI